MRKASTYRLSSSTDPSSAGSETIKVGYVRRAHGVKGGVVVKPLSDDPDRFLSGQSLDTDRDITLTISSAQPHKDGLLVSFVGVEDRDSAERLRGASLLIAPSHRRQLEPDEYWPEQLVGLRVVDRTGADLGTVANVVAGAAQDRLEIDGSSGRFDVPFVAALVTSVDLSLGVVTLDPPAGLID